MSTINVTMHGAGEDNFERMVDRVRAEFVEMPGMVLTRDQAARLWAIEASTCEAVLAALVAAKFLVQTKRAAFVRAA